MSAKVEIGYRLEQGAVVRAAGSSDGELARLVASLLDAPPHKLDLPPRLMKLYLRSRWPARRAMLVTWLLAMAALNALCAALNPFIVQSPEIWLFMIGGVAVSVVFAAAAALIRRMESTGLEGPIVIASCLMMVAVAGVGGLAISPDFMLRALEQAMFGGAVAIIVARIPWRDTLFLSASLIASLVVLAGLAPGLPLTEKVQTILLFGLGVAGLTVVRRTQNRYLYRMFLTGLAERLRIGAVEGMNSRLAAMARTDPLTLLANRRHFDEMLAELQLSTGEAATSAALFMIDIDHFKRLNDDFGHAKGDECLKIIAGLIRAELREGQDFLARFGGEEFVAVLPGLSEVEAHGVAERVREAVVSRRISNPRSPFGVITASIGVAVAPPCDLLLLVAEADAALYEAKSLGRNVVRLSRMERPVRVA